MTMAAWHGDRDLKAKVVARMRAHRAEDSLIKGHYQQHAPNLATGYKGCLIGCTLEHLEKVLRAGESWHERVETEYGIPRAVGHLLDKIFENLPEPAHAAFAVESVTAVPVGADLGLVKGRLMLDFLTDPEHGALRHTAEGSAHRDAAATVVALCRLDEPDKRAWRAAAQAVACAVGYDPDGYDPDCDDPDDYYVADAATHAARTAYAVAASYQFDDGYCVVADAATHASHAHVAAAARPNNWPYAADAWWTWAAERILHHLRIAPAPALVAAAALTPDADTLPEEPTP